MFEGDVSLGQEGTLWPYSVHGREGLALDVRFLAAVQCPYVARKRLSLLICPWAFASALKAAADQIV